jgi:uncharacterized protein
MTHLTYVDRDKFGPWALVTGASSGIGEEFARQLAASGLNLILVARRLPLLEQLGHTLKQKYQIQYRAVELDLTEENFLETLDKVTRDLEIGLVISNAGMPVPGKFLTIERRDLIKSVNLKVIAHLNLAHHFGARLTKRGRGGLLLVSSIGGLQGVPHVANNAATEAYVLSLGEALHVEFEKRGVNVTVLLPGPTDTPGITKQGISPDDMPVKPMSPQQVVAEGLAALNANRATHIAGRMNRWMAALIPRSMATRVMGNMMEKLFTGKR